MSARRWVAWALAMAWVTCAEVRAQEAMTWDVYLARVMETNAGLRAARAGVSRAEAGIEVARVRPDPLVTAGVATWDPSGAVMPTATVLGLSWPVELGGRRGARVDEAGRAAAVARAELAGTVWTLRAEATLAWIEALHARQVAAQRARVQASLERLVAVTRDRQRAGDVGEMAVRQASLEAGRMAVEVLRARGEFEAAREALRAFLGGAPPGELVGALDLPAVTVDVEARVALALRTRDEVRAAEARVAQRRAGEALARANRWGDAAVNLGWTHNFDGLGPNAATPRTVSATPVFEQFALTLTVPVPLSRANRGALDGAAAERAQAEFEAVAARVSVEAEVRAAAARYEAAAECRDRYERGLRREADEVYAAVLYSYQRGAATLIEVIAAQRAVDEVGNGYEEALADHARALVALERATGVATARF